MSPVPSHISLSPSGLLGTYARSVSVASSTSGLAGNTALSISHSIPRHIVCSSSGDSDEFLEVDNTWTTRW